MTASDDGTSVKDSRVAFVKLFVDDPFGVISRWYEVYDQGVLVETDRSSDFKHRLLVFTAILLVRYKEIISSGTTSRWQDDTYLGHSMSALRRAASQISRVRRAEIGECVEMLLEHALSLLVKLD